MKLAVINEEPASISNTEIPEGLQLVNYRSGVDVYEDWALYLRPSKGNNWVIVLHGHGMKYKVEDTILRSLKNPPWIGY